MAQFEKGQSVNISVIICTRNRAKILPELFRSLVQLEIPLGVTWEVLLVDNGSEDATEAVIAEEQSAGRLPIRYLRHAMAGKSRALNVAIDNSVGDLLLFTDDDVIITPQWLLAFWDAAQSLKDVVGFCGRVLPRWEGQVPSWLTAAEPYLPQGMLARCDFGKEPGFLPGRAVPGGGNVALWRDAVTALGRFREEFGPGTSVPYGEDTEYMRRLHQLGHRFWYVPSALIYHRNPAERMTKQYAEKWTFDVARCQAIVFHAGSCTVPMLFGAPRYLWRQLLQRGLAWLIECRHEKRFFKKLEYLKVVGALAGHRSHFASIEKASSSQKRIVPADE